MSCVFLSNSLEQVMGPRMQVVKCAMDALCSGHWAQDAGG